MCSPPHALLLLLPPPQINPGEVKVLKGRSQHVIYTDGTGSDNPYEKLRIKIEATRLAVKVDPVEHVPSSPAGSSHNGSQTGPMVDGGFGSFRPLGNGGPQSCSSQGCSNSQSPTESPMQSWSSSRNGLPTMAPLPPHVGANGGNNGFGNGNGGAFGAHNFGGPQDNGAQGVSFGYSSGLDGSGMGLGNMGGSMGGMGGSSAGFGGFGGANALMQQQQQQASGAPHSSPMRAGYPPYGGSNSFGSTPVF